MPVAVYRSPNVQWHVIEVDKREQAELKGHGASVVWLTGLSGAGKSTIANVLQRKLHNRGYHSSLLDGDNLRHGLSKDLGFTPADRAENIRRVAEVAKLMVEAGLIVVASFISPYRNERAMARQLLASGDFIEVYVDTPLEVAEARDLKGLYARARRGEIQNFTGISAPYEPPLDPEVHIRTVTTNPSEAAQYIMAELHRRNLIGQHMTDTSVTSSGPSHQWVGP